MYKFIFKVIPILIVLFGMLINLISEHTIGLIFCGFILIAEILLLIGENK